MSGCSYHLPGMDPTNATAAGAQLKKNKSSLLRNMCFAMLRNVGFALLRNVDFALTVNSPTANTSLILLAKLEPRRQGALAEVVSPHICPSQFLFRNNFGSLCARCGISPACLVPWDSAEESPFGEGGGLSWGSMSICRGGLPLKGRKSPVRCAI